MSNTVIQENSPEPPEPEDPRVTRGMAYLEGVHANGSRSVSASDWETMRPRVKKYLEHLFRNRVV